MFKKLSLVGFSMKPMAVAVALCSLGLAVNSASAEPTESETLDLAGIVEDIDLDNNTITIAGQEFVLSDDTAMIIEDNSFAAEDVADMEWVADEYSEPSSIDDLYVGETVFVSATEGADGVFSAELLEKIQSGDMEDYADDFVDYLPDVGEGEWEVVEQSLPTAAEIEEALANEENIYKHPDATPEMWEMFLNFVRSGSTGGVIELQDD